MTRLAVFDTVDTPQRFNLLKLVGVIVGPMGSDAAVWNVRRAEGYGLAINRLSEQLNTNPTLQLSLEAVVALLPGVNEWFYWFDAVNDDQSVSFGLADSSYMFVDGPTAVIEAVQNCFGNTREI